LVFKFFSRRSAPSSKREKAVAELVKRSFDIAYRDLSLYMCALRHKSAARNIHNNPEISNERLEFLGDAILDAAVAHHLFLQYPQAEEGELTKMKSRVVSRSNLNRMAHQMGIDKLLETDLQATHARESISGNALEALFGAVYLDLGYQKTYAVMLRLLQKYASLDEVAYQEADFKSRLYEEAHRRRVNLRFDTRNFGDHQGVKSFQSDVYLGLEMLGSGKGGSKKKAEQHASEAALHKLNL